MLRCSGHGVGRVLPWTGAGTAGFVAVNWVNRFSSEQNVVSGATLVTNFISEVQQSIGHDA
jgi:hypothetical protein